jgi:hypothetical protein
MPGRPSFSLNILQASAQTWSNAFGIGDVRKYSGDTLTTADKDTILSKIPVGDLMTLGGTVEAGAIGLTIGNFGIMVGGVADVASQVTNDLVELLLFGNLLRRNPGDPPYTGDSSNARGWAGATAAVSFGMPLRVGTGLLGIGLTAKLTQGIAVAGLEDLGSRLQTVPFEGEVRVHGLYARPDSSISNGFGFGADLGFAYDLVPGIRLGLAVENLIATMSWKDENLLYQRREYRLVQVGGTYEDSVIAEIDETAFDPDDPMQAALRDSLLGKRTFPMRVRAGAELHAGKFILAGDIMLRLASGMVAGEKQRVSAGAELPLGFAAVRGGLSSNFEGGFSMGGGLGLKAGPARLDGAVSWTPGGDRQGLILGVGISVMN